jgi:antagonist of KipI
MPDVPTGGARLRILPGPQAEHFAPSALDVLQHTRYTVSSDSDRMGYRLTGGARVASTVGGGMVSDAAFVGGVQIPPSGDPILLMADRPTTGGYPQIAVVISADLSAAAQLGAGDWVEFEMCSRSDAIAALVAQEGRILAVR